MDMLNFHDCLLWRPPLSQQSTPLQAAVQSLGGKPRLSHRCPTTFSLALAWGLKSVPRAVASLMS